MDVYYVINPVTARVIYRLAKVNEHWWAWQFVGTEWVKAEQARSWKSLWCWAKHQAPGCILVKSII